MLPVLRGDSTTASYSRADMAGIKHLIRSGISASGFTYPVLSTQPSDADFYHDRKDNGRASPGANSRPVPHAARGESNGVIRRRTLSNLATPKVVREKVESDGIALTYMDRIVAKGERCPGVGDYDDDASFDFMSTTGSVSGRPRTTAGPDRWSKLDKQLELKSHDPSPATYHTGQDFSAIGPQVTASLADRNGRSMPRPCSVSMGTPGFGMGKTDLDLIRERAALIPGPSDYSPKNLGGLGKGTRFAKSAAKTDLEWQIYHAKKLPGPGTYKHEAVEMRGGMFNTANSKSELEWDIYRAKQLPGPGEYRARALSGAKGGRISATSPKSEIERLVFEAKLVPGAGDYDPNDSLRFKSANSGKFVSQYRPKVRSAATQKVVKGVHAVIAANRFQATLAALSGVSTPLSNHSGVAGGGGGA